MSWIDLHNESQLLAVQARAHLLEGDNATAEQLYALAAEKEGAALALLDTSKSRTYGITAVSRAALWFKSGQLEVAAECAHLALAHPNLAPFARSDLREMLQTIWNKQTQLESGLIFSKSQLVVAVKGGEILTGGAPLDLIVRKAKEIQGLLLRTVEYLSKRPLRRRGGVPKELLEQFRPWLFQTAPGSYRFVVSLQEPKQLEMFDKTDVTPTQATDKLMAILQASASQSEDALKREVPADDYRRTFMKMVKMLAPRGSSFDRIEIGNSLDGTPTVLARTTAEYLQEIDVPRLIAQGTAVANVIEMKGTLRALHLDDDWLELAVEGEFVRVKGLTDVVDDVIGPMVNQRVNVKVQRSGRSYRFVDIDLDS